MKRTGGYTFVPGNKRSLVKKAVLYIFSYMDQ